VAAVKARNQHYEQLVADALKNIPTKWKNYLLYCDSLTRNECNDTCFIPVISGGCGRISRFIISIITAATLLNLKRLFSQYVP
jgi:hypothetical protein